MSFNPLDIRYQEFKKKLRGYDPEEVRAYLGQVADYVSGLEEQLAEARRRIQELEVELDQAREGEAELKRAVVAAERIAREVRAQAEREAELIRAEAEAAKERTLREAMDHLRKIQRDLERLKRERELFKEQFRGLLEGYLASLEKPEKSSGTKG